MKIINCNKELIKVCKNFKKEEFIAVDFEFISETKYFPELCLIQVGTKQNDYIIDPLASGIEIKPFINILMDKKIKKVFHSGKQDIEIIFNIAKNTPENIFDTQVAAAFIGYGQQISYANLVKKICKKTIDKSSRMTNWKQRPLSEEQIKYALLDVHYLKQIYPKINEQILKLNRQTWVEEEFQKITDTKIYQINAWKAHEKIKYKPTDDTSFTIFVNIAKWREEFAMLKNKPRNKIIRNETIILLADNKIISLEDLNKIRGIKNINLKYLEDVLNIARKSVRQKNKEKIPNKININYNKAYFEMLRIFTNYVADKENISSNYIVKTSELKIIANGDMENNNIQRIMSGWRFDIFGKYLNGFINGDIIAFTKGNTIKFAKNKLNPSNQKLELL